MWVFLVLRIWYYIIMYVLDDDCVYFFYYFGYFFILYKGENILYLLNKFFFCFFKLEFIVGKWK